MLNVNKGYEDAIFPSLEKALKNFKVQNIISEVKRIRDVATKCQFINARSEDYHIWSYPEIYDIDFLLHHPNAPSIYRELRIPEDKKYMERVHWNVTERWIPWEDLWFEKTE